MDVWYETQKITGWVVAKTGNRESDSNLYRSVSEEMREILKEIKSV